MNASAKLAPRVLCALVLAVTLLAVTAAAAGSFAPSANPCFVISNTAFTTTFASYLKTPASKIKEIQEIESDDSVGTVNSDGGATQSCTEGLYVGSKPKSMAAFHHLVVSGKAVGIGIETIVPDTGAPADAQQTWITSDYPSIVAGEQNALTALRKATKGKSFTAHNFGQSGVVAIDGRLPKPKSLGPLGKYGYKAEFALANWSFDSSQKAVLIGVASGTKRLVSQTNKLADLLIPSVLQ